MPDLDQKTQHLENEVMAEVKSFFPVDNGKGRRLEVSELELVRPPLYDNDHEEELKLMGGSLMGYVKGYVSIVDTSKNKVIDKSARKIRIVSIPYRTKRETFIIGGKEKTIWNQMTLKPGVYTFQKKDGIQSLIFLKQGVNLYIKFNPENNSLNVKIGSNRTIAAISLARILGATDGEIQEAIGEPSLAQYLMAKADKKSEEKDIQTLWEDMNLGRGRYPGYEQGKEAVLHYFSDIADFGDTGKDIMKSNIGVSSTRLNSEVLLKAIERIIKVAREQAEADNRDDIRYQNVIDDNDALLTKVREGLQDFAKKRVRFNLGKADAKASTVMSAETIGKPMMKLLTTGDITDYVEETNPLQLLAANRKITKLGEGGLSNRTAEDETRNIQNTHYGKIDPIETPESGKIGLVMHLAKDSTVKGNTIVTRFYKVKDGVTAGEVSLTPMEEYDAYIAFNDAEQVVSEGRHFRIKGRKIMARHRGAILEVSVDKITHIDKSPHSQFGDAANLIPFNAHNDGNRMLMGANMQKQALNLVNREAPLVQTAVTPDRDVTYEDVIGRNYGNPIFSEVNGTVEGVHKNYIEIRDDKGNLHKHDKYDYFPLNMNNFIHNQSTVKKGDKVKKGQMLAEGWMTRHGSLALGTNVKVAYMPWKGYNFEDGIVISRSLANRMTTEEMKEIKVAIEEDQIGGPGSDIKKLLGDSAPPASPAAIAELDEDGVIKKGSEVKAGSILVGIVREQEANTQRPEIAFLRSIGTEFAKHYRNDSETIEGYIHGVVKDVVKLPAGEAGPGNKFAVKINILTRNPLKEGDKLAGRHGNKGIVTAILDDHEMPQTPDGKPVEMILSPLGIPSRKNLGQLLEVNAGLIAEKKGKTFKVYNFDKSERERVEEGLKEIGVPDGKMMLTDPETNHERTFENPVTVGNAYFMKLKHKVDDKIQARDYKGKLDPIYKMPAKSTGEYAGEKENPQKMGEMEMRALQAHKAVFNILESSTFKSDGAGDKKNRQAIFHALAENKPLPDPQTPESLKVFNDYIKGMGLNITPLERGKARTLDDKFDALSINVATDKDIKSWARGPKGKVVTEKDYANMKNGIKPEKGGIFDPSIFGESPKEKRSYWGYIELATPMPNPILMRREYNPYAIVLSNTFKGPQAIEKIVEEDVVVITDPGDTGKGVGEIVQFDEVEKLQSEGKNFKYKWGGEALEHFLEKVDVSKELKETEEKLRQAKDADERASLYRRYRVFKNLKERDLEPTDLLMHTVPVMPVGLRPKRMTQNKIDINDDANTLYKDLITVNNTTSKMLAKYDGGRGTIPEQERYSNTKDLYYRLDGLMTAVPGEYQSSDGRPRKGIMTRISGKPSKFGLIRNRLMSKMVDYSGRSVITVDPTKKLDEAGIPEDIAKKVYKPFIVREMIRKGQARDVLHGLEKWENYDNDPQAQDALRKVIEDRPILLNRAPSLHKFSIMAFKPTLTKGRSIQLNPLVVKGFNADFDGDQMGLHVPLTEKAKDEAKSMMLPSQNMINPTNGRIIIQVQNEMVLGLYYLTMDVGKDKKPEKTYVTLDQLKEDWKQRRIDTHVVVKVGNSTATVGQHIFKEKLPPELRMDRNNWVDVNKNKIDRIIKGIIDNNDNAEAVRMFDDMKELGFYAATKSSLSWGVHDLVRPKNADKAIEEAEENVKKDPSKLVGEWLKVQDQFEKADMWDHTMDRLNPVRISMVSGGKGNPEQVRKMTVAVGLGKDIAGKIVPIPIKSSHLEGLKPYEYWAHAFDSRRGMADRSLSTAEPGALTREIWSSTQDILVTEKDCGDKDGFPQRKHGGGSGSKSLPGDVIGRYLAKPVTAGGVVYKAKTQITSAIKDAMDKDTKVTEIYIRSPITCKSEKGVCQICYGTMPGTASLPMIGEPIGTLASQALGEPTTQMTMKTFHAGGVSNEEDVTVGFPRVEKLMTLSDKPDNPAVISPVTGIVKTVTRGVVTWDVTIEYEDDSGRHKNKTVKIPFAKLDTDYGEKSSRSSKPPEDIIVKPGDMVAAGDPIVKGELDPNKILEFRGLRPTQDYVVSELENVLNRTGVSVNRRHVEVAVKSLTNKGQVTDRSSSPFINGQIVRSTEVNKWNAEHTSLPTKVSTSDHFAVVGAKAAKTYKSGPKVIVNQGEKITEDMLGQLMMRYREIEIYPKPVTLEPQIFGVTKNPLRGGENWFSQMGYQDVREPLSRGAIYGQKDDLDDPRGRGMAGKLQNIGQGYHIFDKFKDVANNTAAVFKNTFAGLF